MYLVRMLSLEESSDVRVGYLKNMGLIGYSIRHFLSKVLLGLRLVMLFSVILPLQKFNLGIIFSLLSIKLSIKQLNTGLGLEANFIVVAWHLGLHGELLVMVPSIILNHLRLILLTLQVSKLLFQEIPSKQKDCY